MTARRPPWVQALYTVLDDGAPHHRDELLEAAARTIPPGVAWRWAERRRRNHSHLPATRTRPVDTDQIIRAAARDLATGSLRTQVRHGHVTRTGDHYQLTGRN